MEWTGSILVVDDDLATCEMLVELLREEGIAARFVRSVDDALEALRQERFEAVLSDIQMPVKDGFALLREVRSLGSCLPVILMTSFGTEETTLQAVGAGAFDCLLKPFPREALLGMLRRAFETKTSLQDSRARS